MREHDSIHDTGVLSNAPPEVSRCLQYSVTRTVSETIAQRASSLTPGEKPRATAGRRSDARRHTVAAGFTTAKGRKQPICPSAGEWTTPGAPSTRRDVIQRRTGGPLPCGRSGREPDPKGRRARDPMCEKRPEQANPDSSVGRWGCQALGEGRSGTRRGGVLGATSSGPPLPPNTHIHAKSTNLEFKFHFFYLKSPD